MIQVRKRVYNLFFLEKSVYCVGFVYIVKKTRILSIDGVWAISDKWISQVKHTRRGNRETPLFNMFLSAYCS